MLTCRKSLQKHWQKTCGLGFQSEEKFHFGCVASVEPLAIAAIPGGFIFVSVGLVDLCRGHEDWLAGVVGHEIGHVVKLMHLRKHLLQKFVQLLSKGAMVGGPLSVLHSASLPF